MTASAARAENEAAVRRYCDAWQRGDLGEMLAC